MIRIESLSFQYPGVRALDRVSAELPDGAITALVGPNGAGKSTLMRCIAGLDVPAEGRVVLDGIHVAADPRAARARLGFLPDLFGLYDRLTVRRCLAWAGAARGLSWDEAAARVPDLATRLGIADLLDRRAGELSRGQRQRVAIGQAIVHAPGHLVLDEPASGLDPEARIALAGLLRALRADGMTLLVSSHILAELAEYATHLMILDEGRLLSCGPLASPLRRIVVGLAAEDARAADVVGAIAGVSAVEATGPRDLAFAFEGDEAALAAVLAALVGAGLKVIRFGPETESLQEVYLDRLREARGTA
jgi:ABC-2 type transport system ATP-binding protein